MSQMDRSCKPRSYELALHVPQVELARYERQQSRQGGVLPQAEALLLAAQQADAIYGRAFQELALQVLASSCTP